MFICCIIWVEKAAYDFGADQIKTLVDDNQNMLIDLYYRGNVVSTKTHSF